jgi:hypothetical protein
MERENHIFWKIKRLASKITYRMFMKYEKLMRRYSITLLESHLKTILDHKKNHVHPGTMSYAIRYVSLATTIPHTMNKLKPFVDTLLY